MDVSSIKDIPIAIHLEAYAIRAPAQTFRTTSTCESVTGPMRL